MSEQQPAEGLRQIRRALLSVSDKTGLIEFARHLRRLGIEILSTGGTAKTLREAGVEVRDVSDVTGFPEMMDGRIKTLHPRIHGALLAVRDNAEHMSAASEHGIELIDLVVINLYPFERTIAREGVTLEEAVEQIDIGGPAMVRSSARISGRGGGRFADDYADLSEEMERNGGALSLPTRERLARNAFRRTAMYDLTISAYLGATEEGVTDTIGTGGFSAVTGRNVPEPHPFEEMLRVFDKFPERMSWTLVKSADLRYGENPHQRAALYGTRETGHCLRRSARRQGNVLNNYVDADAPGSSCAT